MRDKIVAMVEFIRNGCPSETYSGRCAFCGGERCYDSQPTHTPECSFGKALSGSDVLERHEGDAEDTGTRSFGRPDGVPAHARLFMVWGERGSCAPTWFWAWEVTHGTFQTAPHPRKGW